MKIPVCICVLLISTVASAQSNRNAVSASAQPAVSSPTTSTARPDPALNELLIQVQAVAQKTNDDLALLRTDKWKADAASKQQAESSALSIRRNLANAVPDLLLKIQAAPGSLNANFRLYRNFNALFDTCSALTESAGAFGPKEQYAPLAADVSLLDQVRHQLADHVDTLTGANDAELARLRSQATIGSKPVKIVVDDDQPQAKSKKKAKGQPQPSAQQ